MTTNAWLLPGAALLFGLAAGALWSPRPKDPTPKQLAQAITQAQSTKSNNHITHTSSNTQETRSGVRRKRTQAGGSVEELTAENMVQILSFFNNEKDLNLMELLRYGGLLTDASEPQTLELLQNLKNLQTEDDSSFMEGSLVATGALFTRLCELNGPRAMEMLTSGELGPIDQADFGLLGMNSWLAADPEGAKNWVIGTYKQLDQALINEEDFSEEDNPVLAMVASDDFMEQYLYGMSKIDPEGLQESLTQLGSEELREELLGELATQKADAAESQEEILALLSEENHEGGTYKGQLIQKLAESDPAKAKELALSQPPGPERDNLLASLTSDFMREDPAAGAAWYQAQELTDTTEQERLNTITKQWAGRDLEGAAGWLLEQPNTPDRDSSEAALASRSARASEWEAAFRWTSDISDEKHRQKSLDTILSRAWSSHYQTFPPATLQAAKEAGMENALEAYAAKQNQN